MKRVIDPHRFESKGKQRKYAIHPYSDAVSMRIAVWLWPDYLFTPFAPFFLAVADFQTKIVGYALLCISYERIGQRAEPLGLQKEKRWN
jgi:hypothetical protein